MLVADTYLGNTDDDAVAARIEGDDPLRVTLSDTERRRSRVRTTTEDGTDIGITVPEVLSDGDVLVADGRPVVVALAAVDAMVLLFASNVEPAHAVSLGHAVGNRHWDLAVEGDRVLIPVVEDRSHMESFVQPLLPEETTLSYETVPPHTFDDDHSNGGDHGHVEPPKHGHDHGHSTSDVTGDR